MVTRLSAMRAGAVADASRAAPVSEVARRFGVSRQRAHQLLREAKSRAKPKTTGGGTAGEEKENER
jgi:transposase-like protein